MFPRLMAVLTALIFLSFTAHARRSATYNPSLHLMVYVQKGLALSKWTHALPKGSQIIKESHPYYIVRLPKVPVEALLQKLRKIPGVKAVYEDKLIKPARTARSDECPLKAQAANVEDIQELMNIAADDCDLAPSCSEDRRPTMIGQMSVGGDLMLEELKRMGLSGGHTKVAVLDSGFNGALMQQMSRAPSTKYMYLDSRSQFSSESAHGSYVTGVIGAKNGVGLAPGADIGTYGVVVNEAGDTSQALAETQALEACRSGHKIINISFEGIFTDRDKPHIVRDLEAEGCMVVNSAGNSPGSGITGPDAEDGWLRVGGINMQNGKNAPLELGEVNAPGFDIATLDPAAQSDCMGMPLSAVSGTSLAAPIVTAILANVRGILARDPKFEALSGPDEVKLLNRIVKSSVSGGVINGLRAVLTAEAWTKSADPKPMSAQELSGLLARNPPEKCRQPPKNPQIDQISCSERKVSIADMRFRIAACSPLPQAQLETMIRALPRLGEAHLARALSRHLPAGRGDTIVEELGLTVVEKERQEELALAEREGSTRENIAAVDALLNLQSIPASEMNGWSQRLTELERQTNAEIAEAQRRLSTAQGTNAELREDQIAALRTEILEKQRNNACSVRWRNAMGALSLSTEQFFDRVASTENEAGCSWPLNYVSEPYQEVGFGALNGTTYSEYYNGLVRQKADYQLELMLDL